MKPDAKGPAHAACDGQLHERPARAEVHVVQHLVGAQHRRAYDAAPLRLLGDLLHAHAREVRFVELGQHVGVLESAEEGLPMRIRERLGLAEPLPHRAPLARREHDQAHVAALAGVDRVDGPRAVPYLVDREAAVTQDARVAERPVGGLGDSEQRREVDVLAGAGEPALIERQQDGVGGGHRGDVHADRGRRDQRRLRRDPGLEDHAAHGVEHVVGGDPVAVRPAAPEVGERGEHQLGVAREHVARVEREARALRGRVRLDQHVGAREQLVEPGAACRGVEVERRTALAGVPEGEAEARAAVERREAA